MPSPGHGKHRKGAPLAGGEASTSNGRSRTVNWRVQRRDRDAFHALAESRETNASDLAREIADVAARATGEVGPTSDYVYLSSRLPHDRIAQLSAAAAAVELEPTVWLRLMTTGAGDVLLRQLQAARRAMKR